MKSIKLALVCGTLLSAPAMSATIPGLFNTGTGAGNVALAGGDGVTDPHYTIVASTSPGYAGTSPVTYYNGAYPANDADSKWISLSANGNPGLNTTTYRLAFDLTGYDPETAQLSGKYGTDNTGFVRLNDGAQSFASSTFQSFTSFSFTTGFLSGTNYLYFDVSDSGPPTALRVDDLTGTVEPAAVPEPASWAMMVGGFGLIGGALRRRNTRVAFA